MAKNNYPQTALDDIEPKVVQEMVRSIRELYDMGRPQSDDEIKYRVDEYFAFCERSSIRPGIESLCMALHISRTTLYNWSKGINCSEKCQEIIQYAKSFIGAFLEQALLCGKINPASGIFIAKNWLGYKDSISIEENTPQEQKKRCLTAAELPKLLEDAKKLSETEHIDKSVATVRLFASRYNNRNNE